MKSNDHELIFGLHAVANLLESRPDGVEKLFVIKGRKDERMGRLVALAEKVGCPIQQSDRRALDEMVNGNHQGVVAKVLFAEEGREGDLEALLEKLRADGETPLLLILDGVTDPHNLGACARTANCVGVHGIVYPKDRAARLSATVRKVACGAAEFTPFFAVTNLARTMQWLQQWGLWLVGAAGEAELDYRQIDYTGPTGIIMGNEARGLRKLTREHCDQLAFIPINGQVDSLNVSVASGVILYEALRQRT